MKRKTTKEFIEQSIIVHGKKYDYSLVEYLSRHKKVKIICTIHGEFLQYAGHHLMGKGCKKCANEYIGKLKTKTTEDFIKRSNEVHGTLYDYSKSKYVSSESKIEIICLEHGSFWQQVSLHLAGAGCPKCVIDKSKLGRDVFIKRSNKLHNNKYDYSKVIYVNNITKVKITCPIHGEFLQPPSKHLVTGCPKCSFEIGHAKRRKTTEQFIEEARLKYGTKYNYDFVSYKTTNDKVKIICPKHGEFLQKPSVHLRKGSIGCPNCTTSISIKETQWLDSLNNHNILRNFSFRIGKKLFVVDGYDPFTNTIYEFYGDYWHGNLNKFHPEQMNKRIKLTFGELYEKTINRENILIANGYKIISIWEKDFDYGCRLFKAPQSPRKG